MSFKNMEHKVRQVQSLSPPFENITLRGVLIFYPGSENVPIFEQPH